VQSTPHANPGDEQPDGSADPDLQQVLDNLTTAVVVLDSALRVRTINPSAEMLLEVSARSAAGVPIKRLLPFNPGLIEQLRGAQREGRTFTSRGLPLQLAPGRQITVDCSVGAVGGLTGSGHLVIEFSQVDRTLRLVREESLLDQQAASRALLRGLAHEIKNPLGGLRGAAQLLERELADRELREYTRIIIHESDRLRNLVDRMMGLNQPGRIEPVNMHLVLEHVRKLVSAECNYAINIERDYDPSVPECNGDAEQLIQAVLNIARNAAQAVASGGRITLRTRAVRQFTIGATRHRLVLRVDVEDDGPGVPSELQERIFVPMVTGKTTGTGLGLPIAQDIVNRHGGFITFDSEPGRTVFSVYLPVGNDNGK